MFWARCWQKCRQLDLFLDRHALALALALIVLFIRVPTIAEPYWYGDEAIYLTVGNSLRAGERLYVDIIDHKTPLIYYLAWAAESQFGFRMLATLAIMISTVGLYFLLHDFFPQRAQRLAAITVFILYTNLPRYEGNIPNGETFVMTFVILGLLCFRKTKLYQSFIENLGKQPSYAKVSADSRNTVLLFASGVWLGLATLTKVPAVFDLALFFLVGWFVYVDSLAKAKQQEVTFSQALRRSGATLAAVTFQLGVIFSGWAATILLSICYYFLRGSLSEYIDYGLLYNFRYAGSWNPQFPSALVAYFFTLPGKVLLLAGWLYVLTIFRRHFSRGMLLGAAWMALTLFAATLSNRPYPHYFLQVIPGLAIVVGATVTVLWQTLKNWQAAVWQGRGWRQHVTRPVCEVSVAFLSISALLVTLRLLHVQPYPTVRYYQLFSQLATKQITWEEYRDQFNPLLKDNYLLAKTLRRSPEAEIFIWGTNPLLYALSAKNPVGRFTVAFHIDDFNAYRETLLAVQSRKPSYVVVMRDQPPLPGLNEYLSAHYLPNDEYQTFTVWRRTSY